MNGLHFLTSMASISLSGLILCLFPTGKHVMEDKQKKSGHSMLGDSMVAAV